MKKIIHLIFSIFKNRILYIGLGIFMILYLLYEINENIQVRDNSVRFMVQNTDFRKLSEIENEYTINMYEILRPIKRGGFSDYGHKKCMTDREKIKYVSRNFKLARAFDFNYYGVPAEHILESNFNPYKIHEVFSELGLGGFWHGTARMYYLYAQKYMPVHLWRLVKFDFRKSEDLLTWENGLSMSYIWKWVEGKTYTEEMWLESSRRWGKFIYQHYDEGKNIFPDKFIIVWSTGEVKKYNSRKIHYVWKNMIMYFEDGNIIAAHELFSEYRVGTLKLRKEEIQYRTVRQRIKQLEKKINNFEKIELIGKEELKLMKREVQKTKNVLKKIGGEANKIGWRKRTFSDFKNFCKKQWRKFKSEK